ncbi:M20/M25/M40 family metallo-hydrolase [Alteromonas flava]|uniref:M20/M25/M40 family metallo-hydrolase n=1 Tax=Alteromonas flava TaxID=2048003 RepID=UPI000C291DD3|nr:M20/M25/M40 family metallo-hydrolase [Alteromonas flava]
MPIKLVSAVTSAHPALTIAKNLLQLPSITPNDAGCQVYIQQRLSALGFVCDTLRVNGVTNMIAKIGNGNRHLAFNGHTDVVPPGPLKLWDYPPFAAKTFNGYLYGRGAADMKYPRQYATSILTNTPSRIY